VRQVSATVTVIPLVARADAIYFLTFAAELEAHF